MKTPETILIDAVGEHQPAAIVCLFSGGHDSYTVTHFAANLLKDRLTMVAHIDTGIGIPETQQFVKDRCEAHGWPLKIYRAKENVKADGTPDPMIYEDIVKANGFPGAHAHRFMYVKLKGRQVDRIAREYKGEKVMFISGVRQEESVRRMGTAKEVQATGRKIWVAPFVHMRTGS